MKSSRYRYAVISFCALSVGVVALLVGTLAFDSQLSRLSLTAQRWISFATLVLPAIIGGAAGVIGLVARGQNKPLSGLGLVLNVLFGLFFIGVLLIAG